MAIAQFSNRLNSLHDVEPIYLTLFEVRFNNTFLTDNCSSIKNDIMIFNLYTVNDELQPFKIINNMINNNTIINYLEIINSKKDGTIKYCSFLKNFSFVEILGFLDFDWDSWDNNDLKIKNLRVKFKYDKIDVVTSKNYNNFLRKIKLECITKKDS